MAGRLVTLPLLAMKNFPDPDRRVTRHRADRAGIFSYCLRKKSHPPTFPSSRKGWIMLRILAFLAVCAMAVVVCWLTWEAGTHVWPEDRSRIEEAAEFFQPITGR